MASSRRFVPGHPRRRGPAWVLTCALPLLFLVAAAAEATDSPATEALSPPPPVDAFLTLVVGRPDDHDDALNMIDSLWLPVSAPMALDAVRLARDPRIPGRLMKLLREHTGQRLGFDVERWWQWVWQQSFELPPEYADFKGRLYAVIDGRFRRYFRPRWLPTARIRLDEVRWGGVRQDGIPPLRNPPMIDAATADTWLDEDDVVFGFTIDHHARAYPKRILAWHELLTDSVADEPVAGVYCTLCGSMIVYRTRVEGIDHELGTSGFLFRSNKLMYDARTQSLWSTLWGEPVFGPLADSGIRLPRVPVVTTSWKAWRARHPETLVLSRDTGYDRDYPEGDAYRDYFSTDELMFTVPRADRRLRNKDEVLGILLTDAAPLAIAHRFLRKRPIHHEAIGATRIVVLTDPSGAHRVYAAGDVTFKEELKGDVVDLDGGRWLVSEEGLVSLVDGTMLPRLPAHRAFWFGWVSAFPQTRLVE